MEQKEMSTAIVKAEPVPPMTIAEVKEQVTIIQEVLKGVMLKGTHFDALPGCGDKPVLLKPGAEKILATFHIGIEIFVEDLGDGYDVRYRVICRGFHIPTGRTVGYGIGEASTQEKKYKWRAAVCHEEFEDTLETRRQIYYYKTRSGKVEKIEQVRQNPADIANTVLKMAKKRAEVDLCLTATACSDIFVQDMDDPDLNPAADPANRYQQPAQAPQQNPPSAQAPNHAEPAADQGEYLSPAQQKMLYAKYKQKGLSDQEAKYIFWSVSGQDDTRKILKVCCNEIVKHIDAAVPGQVLPKEG